MTQSMWCGDQSPHPAHDWGAHHCRGKGQFSWFIPPDYTPKEVSLVLKEQKDALHNERTPQEILATGAAWVTETELARLVEQLEAARGALQEIVDLYVKYRQRTVYVGDIARKGLSPYSSKESEPSGERVATRGAERVKATLFCWIENVWRRLRGRPTVSRDNWL